MIALHPKPSRPRTHHWIWLLVLSSLFAIRPLEAQQASTAISVDVKVVNILATVRGKKGQIVSDLNKEDFTLEEDGRPQSIHYFSRETDLPLTLGLLVDTSMSQRRVLDQERDASHSFLDQILREDKDKAFVIHFDKQVELLQDLTPSRKKLEAALDQLQMPQPQDTGGYGTGGGRRGGRGGGGGGTALYDAVYLASNEIMKKQTGRKALIILSDGVDNASKVTLETAIESAQQADTLVYSILFSDEQAYGNPGGFGQPGMGRIGGIGGMGGRRGGMGRYPQPQQQHPDGKKVLERISRETGARLFEVSKKQPIDQIYAEIEDELRNQYSIGYTPDRVDTGAEYHKIRLTTKQKDLVVQTRDGYYSAQ